MKVLQLIQNKLDLKIQLIWKFFIIDQSVELLKKRTHEPSIHWKERKGN